jgi:hypothetical protein
LALSIFLRERNRELSNAVTYIHVLEVDGEQFGGDLLALVRGKNNRLILFKRDSDFALVHHLQLRADSGKHNLYPEE